ncbi:helix-turn-helix domain-containing protein [Mycolicibacterium fortuitum]|uniref:helix-turn-helix domain-containing protein n=1 Tax=Mycolicibacterium fortuitum TaxID=1766 RepID=UPI0014906613|nr:helix-turn-helix transcriptional regulator [Mycolicibacterium fortuitum]
MQRDTDGPDPVEAIEVNKQFGDLMRTCRESRGLSQRQLAEMLHEVDLRLDPSAITRIERGSRDVKLSEALAIAGLLEFNLDEIAFSPEAEFRLREESEYKLMVRARKSLLDAVRYIDRWVNNTDVETEESLVKKRELADVVSLYTYVFGAANPFGRGRTFGRFGNLGRSDGDNYAIYYNDTDRAVKQAIVDAVVNGILVSEDEFVEHINGKKSDGPDA